MEFDLKFGLVERGTTGHRASAEVADVDAEVDALDRIGPRELYMTHLRGEDREWAVRIMAGDTVARQERRRRWMWLASRSEDFVMQDRELALYCIALKKDRKKSRSMHHAVNGYTWSKLNALTPHHSIFSQPHRSRSATPPQVEVAHANH